MQRDVYHSPLFLTLAWAQFLCGYEAYIGVVVPCCLGSQWGIAQFAEAKDDAHPDAIACRLRLTLVCVEAQCADVAPSDDKDYAA